MTLNRFMFVCFLLPLLLLLGAGGYWMFSRSDEIKVDSSASRLLASDPRSLESFEKIDGLMPGTEMVLVALEMEEIFSNRGAAVIQQASSLMMSVEGAQEVKSLTFSGRPVRQGMGLIQKAFMPLSAVPEEWKEIRDFVTRFPLSRNILVSEDGHYAILIGIYNRPLPDHAAREAFRKEFMEIMETVNSEVIAVHVLAFPFIEAEGVNAVKSDLKQYLITAGVLIFLVLLLTFRSWITVLTVLVLEGSGVLILLGIFQLFGRPVDLYSGILFPLIGGLQLTFVVHYLSALQHAGRQYPAFQAARLAFREVFPPSCIAALTTVAGLLTLAFADLPTLTDFGRIGAAAVAAVFLFTFLFPAIWAAGKVPPTIPAPSQSHKKHPLPVRAAYGFLILAVSFCLVISVGIFKIRTDIRAVEFIETGHPVRESLELLDTQLGGTNLFAVWVRTEQPFGLQTLPVLRYLEDLRAYANDLEGVSDAYAYSQLYLALNQIWNQDPDPVGTLPQTAEKLMVFSQLINISPLLFKDSFVDDRASSSLFIIRSRDMSGKKYLALLKDFMAYAEHQAPEGISLHPTKGLHTILEGDRKIVSNQLKTLGITLVLIGLLLTLLWLSPRLAGLILLANVPALLTIFGMMGYTGYPMNSITVMVAAVILGIAVDDGIHLVSAFRHLKKKGEDSKDAASEALRRKIKPMACTSSILAVFLGLLMLTSFPPVAHFGILSALGIVAAFFGAVILLPGMLAKR